MLRQHRLRAIGPDEMGSSGLNAEFIAGNSRGVTQNLRDLRTPAPAPPAAAPSATGAPATTAAVATPEDDDILEGIVVPGDTPPSPDQPPTPPRAPDA